MNVVLPQNLEDYVVELVKTKGYQGTNDVVAEALLEHRLRHEGTEIEMTAKLERLLDEGLENLAQAKTTDQLRRRS